MLFQLSMVGFEWILGVGIMFGLAFVMNVLTFDSMSSFFIWLTIFCAIVVWADLLPLWVLILCILVLTAIMYFESKNRGSGD